LAAANASGYSGHFILVNLVAAQHGYAAAVTADHGLLERFVNEMGMAWQQMAVVINGCINGRS
jgi:hypothetical protein